MRLAMAGRLASALMVAALTAAAVPGIAAAAGVHSGVHTEAPSAAAPSGPGVYRMVTADGNIFSFGGADFYGALPSVHLNKPIVGMAATPDGHGYWLVASDGGIFNFGDAGFYGSTGNIHLNKPIVGMAPTPDGHGYWLVASDGGIFNFGDAGFYGSTGNIHLNKPVVGMAPSAGGHGYWLDASDGGIFNFGDAGFYGSTGNIHLNKPVVGMASTAGGHGYWLVASDGGIFNFGDAPFEGSAGSNPLTAPVVGMASFPGNPVPIPYTSCSTQPVLPDSGPWVARPVSVPSLALVPLPGNPPPDVADTPQSDVPPAFAGTVLAPADTALYPGPRPAVVVLHGMSGNQCQIWWLAAFLAGNGFVTMVITSPTPPGDPGPSEDVEIDAARSAVYFLDSASNPYASRTEVGDIGLAGWSEGSIASSAAQGLPDMGAVHAIVAMDNLRGSFRGDLGAPVAFCDGPVQGVMIPKVPALGFANDVACDQSNPADTTVTSKQSGWIRWRQAGQQAVELPMAGFVHATFSQPVLPVGELALAWFNAWLGHQPNALLAFVSCTTGSQSTPGMLSTRFWSAAYLPSLGLDTSNFRPLLAARC